MVNPTGGCPSAGTAPTNPTHSATYSTSNRVSTSDTGGLVYDVAGNVIQDSINTYVYDPEGRLCVVKNTQTTAATQYVYDASGERVAKGVLGSPSTGTACAAPTAANGFTLSSSYLRGAGGGLDSELIQATSTTVSAWNHNVYVGGSLFATYDYANTLPCIGCPAPTPTLSFSFNDWLGTKRLQVNSSGQATNYWGSDPFGDYLTESGSGSDATKQHFTGKERDTESGNDYFGARYYASSMGRWLSPDWAAKEEPVPYATMDDPQSLNLYSYVRNNPLSRTDPDGHCDSNGQNCSAWDHIAGAIGGALNIIPATLNLPNEAFNAISGAFNGPQIDLIPMIQADAHASQGGIDVGTAAATAVPVAAAAAEVTTAGMVVGEVRTAAAGEAAVPESVRGGQAPDQVTPGTTNVTGEYNSPNRGAAEPYSAHYDEHGRQTGRTDYTSQPDPKTHTNPHHHTREYGPGYGPKGKETGPHPGPHPKDKP